MDVQPLPKAAAGADPFRQEAALLIETVGTPSFETHLFRAAWEAIRCEHLSAFASSPSGTPRLLLGVSRDEYHLARCVGAAYVSRYWKSDPLNRLAVSTAALDHGIALRVNADELSNLSYRRELYGQADWISVGAKLIDRLSLAKRYNGDIIRINFYRHRDNGPFQAHDLDKLAASADILFALLAKHNPPRLLLQSAASIDTYRRLLKEAAPELSPREAEVCAGIAIGMTSEAIASRLGIRLNTVLTYRKRAYARLNISSQLELVRLVFSTVIDTRPEPAFSGPH